MRANTFSVKTNCLWRRFGTSKLHLRPPLSCLGCCRFLCSGLVVVDLLFIVAPIVSVVLCLALVLLCCTLCLSSFATILMGKRELVAIL